MVAKENKEVLLEAWRQEEQLLIEKDLKVCPISALSLPLTWSYSSVLRRERLGFLTAGRS